MFSVVDNPDLFMNELGVLSKVKTVAEASSLINSIGDGENKIIGVKFTTVGEFATIKNAINTCLGTVGLVIDFTGVLPEGAFKDCSKLTQITLAEGLTEIGARAFTNTKITKLIIPSTVTTIADYAFQGMAYLKKADLSKIRSITNNPGPGFCMFRSDAALEEVILPSCMAVLPGGIFNGCTKLIANGEYDKLVKSKGYTIQGNCVIKNNKTIMALVNSPNDVITIPSGVSKVGKFTFASLTFKQLVIPDSVVELEGMFYTDANIEEFNFADTTSMWNGECYSNYNTATPTNNFAQNKNDFVENSKLGHLPHDAHWKKKL